MEELSHWASSRRAASNQFGDPGLVSRVFIAAWPLLVFPNEAVITHGKSSTMKKLLGANEFRRDGRWFCVRGSLKQRITLVSGFCLMNTTARCFIAVVRCFIALLIHCYDSLFHCFNDSLLWFAVSLLRCWFAVSLLCSLFQCITNGSLIHCYGSLFHCFIDGLLFLYYDSLFHDLVGGSIWFTVSLLRWVIHIAPGLGMANFYSVIPWPYWNIYLLIYSLSEFSFIGRVPSSLVPHYLPIIRIHFLLIFYNVNVFACQCYTDGWTEYVVTWYSRCYLGFN